MWLPAITTVPPEAPPITLDMATSQLRGIAADEGPYVDGLISSARARIESYTGLRLVSQTLELRAGSFADLAHFEVGPVRSIESIRYLDQAGAEQLLDPETYELFGAGLTRGVRPAFGQRWPAIRPVDDAIVVTAIVGYDLDGSLPADVSHALLLLVGDWYQNREDTIAERSVTPAALPNGVTTLLTDWRV
jgi:uncharacterized phiE125 gp8 family phage protein